MSEPYYEPYVVRHPLDYGMTRAYSGGYIGPGASKVSTVRGFLFLNRLSFNSSAPSPFAFSTAPSCLFSSPPLQPRVLPPPAPIATLSFPSSPCSVSALRPLSFSSSYRSFSYSFFFLSSTSCSPPSSFPHSSSPPPLSSHPPPPLPSSPTQTSQVNQSETGV